MPTYPRGTGDKLIGVDDLRPLVESIFQSCGMHGRDARLLSDTLVAADLRGCHSHGVLRVPDYVKKLCVDGVDPQAAPSVVKDRAAALVVDGNNAMGQVACEFAMRKAIERARDMGTAVAAVRGSNHCGAMAYFAMLPLASDMIGIATTNALPTMAPWGGRDRIIGINPLGVAIPAGQEHPLVFDAAFSGSSHGKIRVYHQKGLDIPDGWAFDKDGAPTTDPAAAIDGLLQPIGGYKGIGIAIVMGVLSSMLSGASYGTELGNMIDGPKAGEDGHFLMAINVAAFEDVSLFKQRMDGAIRQIRQSQPAEGQVIYAPGGLEAETEARHLDEGIPLNQVTMEGLLTSARDCGVDLSQFSGPWQE